MPGVKERAERILDQSLQDNLHEYAGKWVVVTSSEVIAAAGTAERAWASAAELGVTDGTLYRVPDKDTFYIL